MTQGKQCRGSYVQYANKRRIWAPREVITDSPIEIDILSTRVVNLIHFPAKYCADMVHVTFTVAGEDDAKQVGFRAKPVAICFSSV